MLKLLISAFSGLGYRSVPKYPFLRFHFRTVKPTCRAYGYVTNKYLYFIFTWLNFSLTLRRYFNNLIHTMTNKLVLKLSLLPSRITSSHFQKSKKWFCILNKRNYFKPEWIEWKFVWLTISYQSLKLRSESEAYRYYRHQSVAHQTTRVRGLCKQVKSKIQIFYETMARKLQIWFFSTKHFGQILYW